MSKKGGFGRLFYCPGAKIAREDRVQSLEVAIKENAMAYVDGFVIAVPKDKLDAYKAMSRECEPVWREYGAIDYVECVGDDVPYGKVTSFPRAVQATEDEVVIFSWIVYESREARDTVNNKAMNDPRMKKYENAVPFDGKRMIYGGFKPFLGR
jgi:uncharacterized protein YbaA (DUF1428 family)